MSSKLLADDRAGGAERIEWPTLDGPSVTPAPAAPKQPARPSEPPPDMAQLLAAQQRRIQELEQEVERRAREAYQQGHSAGLGESRQQWDQQFRPVMERLAQAIEEITGLRRKVRTEAEEDAVRLAIAIAHKVLHREVSIDPESLLGLVKAAMQRIDAREIHRVRMHPDDIPLLERHLGRQGLPARLEVMADTTLERGSVVLETSRGSLDASISTQLAEIERGFVDLLHRNREGN